MFIYQNIVRTITSPESFTTESNSTETDSSNEEALDEISYIGNKKVLKCTFDNLKDKIPFDIDR